MANTVLKIGIKCKNIPDLFDPIIAIPFIQQINEANPGKKNYIGQS